MKTNNQWYRKDTPKHVDTPWGPVTVCSAMWDKKAVHSPAPFRIIDSLTGLTQCGDCAGSIPSEGYLRIDKLFKEGKYV